MSTELQKWSDRAMFAAAPMQKTDGLIQPKVYLLSATPDPLGAAAAFFRMYRGKPTYDLSEVTDDERREVLAEVRKTHLQTPFEAIDFHFFIEAVTRAWTHQAVRKRQNSYAQESLRFAVKEGLASEVALPPSLVGKEDHLTAIWQGTIGAIEMAYNRLIEAGIPAEDARGLLPHATTTRMNYKTDLRTLIDELDNRLCTQAQFEWRSVALGMLTAIRSHKPPAPRIANLPPDYEGSVRESVNDWQFELLATSGIFAPVCYHTDKCMFESIADRQCSIRSRVRKFGEHGIPSSEWHQDHRFDYGPDADSVEGGELVFGINPHEWASDPTAGRRD